MLATNIIRQFITQVIGLVSGFVISIVTARLLGPEGRGAFSLLLNTSGFLSLLLSFSFGTSIIHIIASGKMSQRDTVNTFLVIIPCIVIITAIFLFFFPFSKFSFLLPSDHEKHPLLYPILLIILFIISMIISLFNSVLSGNRLFWHQQKVIMAYNIISMVLYVVLFIFRKELEISLTTFLYFYLFIASLPAIGLYLMYLKHGRQPFTFSFLNSSELKYIFSFSLMAYLCNVFQFLSYRMDFWFVEYFNGNKDLGIYSLAVNLAQMLWLLPQAISIILISYTGAESPEKGIQNTNTLSRIAMALILTATLILALSIDYIIPLLYGKEFTPSSYIFKILLAGIVPFSITTILASFFAGTGKIFVNLFCSMIGFLICLVFDLLLIPEYGNTGAAIATVIAYFASTAFIIYMYIRTTKTQLSDLVILRKQDIEMLRTKLNGILKK